MRLKQKLIPRYKHNNKLNPNQTHNVTLNLNQLWNSRRHLSLLTSPLCNVQRVDPGDRPRDSSPKLHNIPPVGKYMTSPRQDISEILPWLPSCINRDWICRLFGWGYNKNSRNSKKPDMHKQYYASSVVLSIQKFTKAYILKHCFALYKKGIHKNNPKDYFWKYKNVMLDLKKKKNVTTYKTTKRKFFIQAQLFISHAYKYTRRLHTHRTPREIGLPKMLQTVVSFRQLAEHTFKLKTHLYPHKTRSLLTGSSRLPSRFIVFCRKQM